MSIVDRDGDGWRERPDDFGPPVTINYSHGSGELRSAFTGPPVSTVALHPNRPLYPVWGTPREVSRRIGPTSAPAVRPRGVLPELRDLAQRPTPPASDVHRAFEQFLATVDWNKRVVDYILRHIQVGDLMSAFLIQ